MVIYNNQPKETIFLFIQLYYTTTLRTANISQYVHQITLFKTFNHQFINC